MVRHRDSRAAQPCLCVFIQHADRLYVLVSRPYPSRNCGGWTASAFSALIWTAACLNDPARKSRLGTSSSEYCRDHVRGSCSAICKVVRSKIYESIKKPRVWGPCFFACVRVDAINLPGYCLYLLITIGHLSFTADLTFIRRKYAFKLTAVSAVFIMIDDISLVFLSMTGMADDRCYLYKYRQGNIY